MAQRMMQRMTELDIDESLLDEAAVDAAFAVYAENGGQSGKLSDSPALHGLVARMFPGRPCDRATYSFHPIGGLRQAKGLTVRFQVADGIEDSIRVDPGPCIRHATRTVDVLE